MSIFWNVPDNPPDEPDCLILLSYAVQDRTTPTAPTRAEIELAYRWWQRFPDVTLIMSTGDNQALGVTNAKIMADYAERLGVPRARILLEDRSRNTYENLLYSRELVAQHGYKQPTLVTLDLFTRRALATARRMGWNDLHWLSVYARGGAAYGHKRLFTSSRATTFAYEVLATMYGKFVGWT